MPVQNIHLSSQLCSSSAPAELSGCASAFLEELLRGEYRDVRILLLDGPLGSGKTSFLSALASAMGITEAVDSPTFVVMQEYDLEKKLPWKRFVHIDLYRLLEDTALVVSRLVEEGIDEVLRDPEAFVVVEWGADLVEYCRSQKMSILHLSFSVSEQESSRYLISVVPEQF